VAAKGIKRVKRKSAGGCDAVSGRRAGIGDGRRDITDSGERQCRGCDRQRGGREEKSAVQLKIAPQTAYVTIINQATTGKAGSRTSLRYENEKLKSGWNTDRHTYRQHGSGCEAGDGGLRGS